VKWILEITDKYRDVRKTVAHLVPIIMRTTYCVLNSAIQKKFGGDSIPLIAKVATQRFIEWAFLHPANYGIAPFNWVATEPAMKALEFFTKILHCLGFNEKFENHPYSHLIDEYVEQRYPATLFGMAALASEEALMKVKEVVEASLLQEPSTTEKKLALNDLTNFLNNARLTERFKSTMDMKEKQEFVVQIHSLEIKWSKKISNKEVITFKRKGDKCPLIKTIAQINCSREKAFEALKGLTIIKIDPNAQKIRLLEKVDENHKNYYMCIKMPFPFAIRDLVFCDYVNHQTYMILNYSIFKDIPRVEGKVRANMIVSAILLEPSKGDTIKLTRYFQMDITGNAPKWFYRRMYGDHNNIILRLKKYLEGNWNGKLLNIDDIK